MIRHFLLDTGIAQDFQEDRRGVRARAKAKAKGTPVEQDPWSLTVLYHGSIVDVPVTPEAEERTRRLDALIARLERENAGAATAEQPGVRDQVQHIAVSTSPPITEAPVNATKS